MYLQHRVQILSRSWIDKGKAGKIKERVKIKHSHNTITLTLNKYIYKKKKQSWKKVSENNYTIKVSRVADLTLYQCYEKTKAQSFLEVKYHHILNLKIHHLAKL